MEFTFEGFPNGAVGLWFVWWIYLNPNGVRTRADGIPETCLGCPFFEDTEYDDAGSVWAKPFCYRNVKFPTRKGTCAIKLETAANAPNSRSEGVISPATVRHSARRK